MREWREEWRYKVQGTAAIFKEVTSSMPQDNSKNVSMSEWLHLKSGPTFLAITMPEGLCSTFRTTPPLPNPSSSRREKCGSRSSPCSMIFLFFFRKFIRFVFCSSVRSSIPSTALISESILHRGGGGMLNPPVAVEVFLPTYSVVLPTPEMNPPSGLSEAWASPPAPMLIGGGFTFVFLSGPDISPKME